MSRNQNTNPSATNQNNDSLNGFSLDGTITPRNSADTPPAYPASISLQIDPPERHASISSHTGQPAAVKSPTNVGRRSILDDTLIKPNDLTASIKPLQENLQAFNESPASENGLRRKPSTFKRIRQIAQNGYQRGYALTVESPAVPKRRTWAREFCRKNTEDYFPKRCDEYFACNFYKHEFMLTKDVRMTNNMYFIPNDVIYSEARILTHDYERIKRHDSWISTLNVGGVAVDVLKMQSYVIPGNRLRDGMNEHLTRKRWTRFLCNILKWIMIIFFTATLTAVAIRSQYEDLRTDAMNTVDYICSSFCEYDSCEPETSVQECPEQKCPDQECPVQECTPPEVSPFPFYDNLCKKECIFKMENKDTVFPSSSCDNTCLAYMKNNLLKRCDDDQCKPHCHQQFCTGTEYEFLSEGICLLVGKNMFDVPYNTDILTDKQVALLKVGCVEDPTHIDLDIVESVIADSVFAKNELPQIMLKDIKAINAQMTSIKTDANEFKNQINEFKVKSNDLRSKINSQASVITNLKASLAEASAQVLTSDAFTQNANMRLYFVSAASCIGLLSTLYLLINLRSENKRLKAGIKTDQKQNSLMNKLSAAKDLVKDSAIAVSTSIGATKDQVINSVCTTTETIKNQVIESALTAVAKINDTKDQAIDFVYRCAKSVRGKK